MQLHRGRLIDHIQLRCADFEASKKFYSEVLALLRLELVELTPKMVYADELVLTPAESDPVSRIHLAFQVPSREMVDRFHAVALGAGGRDNGPPGERPYHPGYYAAYVFDPDGNNVEAVHHGAGTRSADSIVIQPATAP